MKAVQAVVPIMQECASERAPDQECTDVVLVLILPITNYNILFYLSFLCFMVSLDLSAFFQNILK